MRAWKLGRVGEIVSDVKQHHLIGLIQIHHMIYTSFRGAGGAGGPDRLSVLVDGVKFPIPSGGWVGDDNDPDEPQVSLITP